MYLEYIPFNVLLTMRDGQERIVTIVHCDGFRNLQNELEMKKMGLFSAFGVSF